MVRETARKKRLASKSALVPLFARPPSWTAPSFLVAAEADALVRIARNMLPPSTELERQAVTSLRVNASQLALVDAALVHNMSIRAAMLVGLPAANVEGITLSRALPGARYGWHIDSPPQIAIVGGLTRVATVLVYLTTHTKVPTRSAGAGATVFPHARYAYEAPHPPVGATNAWAGLPVSDQGCRRLERGRVQPLARSAIVWLNYHIVNRTSSPMRGLTCAERTCARLRRLLASAGQSVPPSGALAAGDVIPEALHGSCAIDTEERERWVMQVWLHNGAFDSADVILPSVRARLVRGLKQHGTDPQGRCIGY